MKKLLSILLALVMVIGMAFTSMAEEKSSERMLLTHEDWAQDVKDNVNQFLELYGKGGPLYYGTEYAVFDFDNTCSIFDVEEQLAIYQLQTMTFAITPEQLPDVLFTEIGDHDENISFEKMKEIELIKINGKIIIHIWINNLHFLII